MSMNANKNITWFSQSNGTRRKQKFDYNMITANVRISIEFGKTDSNRTKKMIS